MTRMLIALTTAMALSTAAPLLPSSVDLGLQAHAKKNKDEAAPQVVMINLKQGTNDLHAVFMALKLGTAVAAKGADVTVFLNLEAARLASKGQPTDLTWGMSKTTLQDLIDEFTAAEGKFLVCPHCAMAAGIDADDLREGFVIPEEDEVADLLIAADKVMDY
jgi:predicted peroxiredoxin